MIQNLRSVLVVLTTLALAAPAWAYPDVLLIYDTNDANTQALVAALEAGGATVTLSDTDETGYDGTNPDPTAFDTVLHLNGTTYSSEMPTAGQDALVDFVDDGGGFIHGEWCAYEYGNGRMANMRDLILFDRDSGQEGSITVTAVAGYETHAVLDYVPDSFTFNAGQNEGYVYYFGVDEPEVIMTDNYGYDAVAVREWGQGRIVGFHHSGNYGGYDTLSDTNIQQLYLGAVEWTAAAGCADDLDGDGYIAQNCGGDDCDDGDAAVNPGATEIACDYFDNDCDGDLHEEETDDDGDGWDECLGDCDDTDAGTYPGSVEVACDWQDNDCDGQLHEEEVDDDADGYDECQGDCDDADPAIGPGVAEVACNGIDDNCDGIQPPDDADDDGDGYEVCAGDCNDQDPAINPAAVEDDCDFVDNDCDGDLHPLEADYDGDGYAVCEGDCDDGDAAVRPGVAEVACDWIDNNCDGDLHDDEADADGDGVDVCGGDCDDAYADTYPGAVEICDSEDNDCDGDVDEGAVDATTWFEDADGDGYGGAGVVEVDCDRPTGFVSNADDCDDANPMIFPLATEARDGADNDCDGLYDEGTFGPDSLIVTEIMQNPDAVLDDFGEWFEVYNNTATDMNMVGLVVYDLGSNVFTVEADLWIPAYAHAVVGADGDPGLNGGVPVDYVWPVFNLANGDDELFLEHGGVVLDSVAWDGGVLWIDPTGVAMSLEPTGYDTTYNDDPAYWCEASTPFGLGDLGTPGDTNPTCCPDADGDGFMDDTCGGDDCDDADPAVHPGAEEVCDGIDNDCDNLTPEDLDMDADGFTICTGDCDDDDDLRAPDLEEVCDGFDNDCDAATDEAVDGDGDGATICDGDCDDAEAAVHPTATEICDGLDNDCDGYPYNDEVDDDGDGVLLCDGDCDDEDPDTYPGAPELCDEVDNDCDTEVDEDVDEDLDGDGFNACQGDCDNDDAMVYPGAEEVCDGADNDCDGVLPDDEADEDGDGYAECEGDCDDGDASMEIDDADGDGVTTCDGDCDDVDATVYPGAEELCDGMDNDCDGVGDDADGDGFEPEECGGEDCDDSDPNIRPGIDEICDDGVDNDCDGAVDGDDEACAAGDDDDSAAEAGDCECRTGGGAAGSTGVLALLLLCATRRLRRRA